MDVSKLTPAPWSSVAQVDITLGSMELKRTGLFFLCHELKPIASFLNEADCDSAALARNAFDVMTRRGWTAERWQEGGKWHWGVTDGESCKLLAQAYDPFTAMVEADKWYRENVENLNSP